MSTDGQGVADTFTGHKRGSRGYRRILVALFFAGIATFAQLYSFQGVLPLFAKSETVSPANAALTISIATVTLASGVLPWSWFADRFGRVAAMRASLAGAVLAGLAVPFCPDYTAILVLRGLEGFALAGVPAIAITYLQEEVHASTVAVAAATYVSGTTLGGLIGRLIAAPMGSAFGWRAGVLSVVILTAIAAGLFFAITPKPQGFRRSSPVGPSIRHIVVTHLSNPRLLVLFGEAFLLMGCFVAVYNYLGFRLEREPFDLSPGASAALFLAYLAGTVSSRVAGSLVVRLSRAAVLIGSTVIMLTGALLTLGTSLWAVVPGLVIFTAGFFSAHSVASGWVAGRAQVGRVQATSLYNGFYYLGSSVLGWTLGVIYTGTNWGGLIVAVAIVIAAAAIWALTDAKSARPHIMTAAVKHLD